VLKFFAYLHNRENFKDDVKEFLNHFAKDKQEELDISVERQRFLQVVEQLSQIFDRPVLRSTSKTTPLNIFEALMVGAAEVLKETATLGDVSGGELVDDEELFEFSSGGANSKK